VTALTLVGVSHHRAPIDLRERVALDLDACRAMVERLGGEAVVLSTCNRTEVYLAREEDAEDEAVAAVTELAGDHAADLSAALYRLRDEAAALHLFRVAAGLDSLVPGEGEILGQVRSAFEAGAPGPLLDRLFRQALHTGRRVRVETAIGESPASVPSAAAALAQQVALAECGAALAVTLHGRARKVAVHDRDAGLAAERLEEPRDACGRPRGVAPPIRPIGDQSFVGDQIEDPSGPARDRSTAVLIRPPVRVATANTGFDLRG